MGYRLFKWRNLVCLPMIAILPVSLLADDTEAAMLRSSGGVLLNRNSAPASAALFPHDLIETQKNVVARIEATGSAVDINPETMVQFDGGELFLDHGSLSVSTFRELRVRAGCVTVTPVNPESTDYEITDVDGKVTVAALKNDVYLDSRSGRPLPAAQSTHSGRVIVKEGERKSRDEKCGAATPKSDSVPGRGAVLNSPWAIGAGVATIGVLACWALCRGDDPISPDHP